MYKTGIQVLPQVVSVVPNTVLNGISVGIYVVKEKAPAPISRTLLYPKTDMIEDTEVVAINILVCIY